MGGVKKAILLVAGLGNRLRPLTDIVPKCLVEVNGVPILINTLNHLAQEGIKEAILVTGYLDAVIRERIGSNYQGMKVEYIKSEEYNKTNNMFSLWLARKHLEKGALVIEGDSFFEREFLHRLLQTDSKKSFWAADKFSLFKEGCMLTSDDSRQIVKIQIVREALPEYKDNFYKSGGMLKITPKFGKLFSQWLDLEVKAGNVNVYYDLILAKYLEQMNGANKTNGAADKPLHICDIHGLKWFEIDDMNDLKKTEELFREK